MAQIIRTSCVIVILTLAGNLHAMKRELEGAETPAKKRFHSNENYYPPFAFAKSSDFPNVDPETFSCWYRNRLANEGFNLSDLKEFISLKDIIQRVQNSSLDNDFPLGDPVHHRASLLISAIEKAATKQNDEALNLLTVAAINGSWIATSFFCYLKRLGNKNQSADTMPIRDYLSEAIDSDWMMAVDFALWNDPNDEKWPESVLCPYFRETLLVTPHCEKLEFTFGVNGDIPLLSHLLSYISKTSTKLRQLYIDNLDFENDDGERFASSLATAKGLKKVCCKGCEFSEGTFAALGLSLQNLNLKKLSLGACALGPQSIMSLSCALHLNTSLRSLDLSSNSLGNEGILHLQKALVHNTTLTKLLLYDVHITAEGAYTLAHLLKAHRNLTSLALGEIELDDDRAISALREAVLTLSQLQRLIFLFTGDIPESFTSHLSKQLRILSISFHCINRKCEIARYLINNLTLWSLDLGTINMHNAQQLLTALKQNDILTECYFCIEDEHVPYECQKQLKQDIEHEITKNQHIEEIRRNLTHQFYKESKFVIAQKATLLIYLALKLDDNSFPSLMGFPHELLREIFLIMVDLEIQTIKHPPTALATAASASKQNAFYNDEILDPGEWQMPTEEEFLLMLEQ